jgi:hypothetical protein
MNPFYIWFVIFSLVGYLIVSDASVARFFLLILSLAKVEYEKIKWWIVYNPQNPVVKYLMWRRAWKLAKELQNEIEMERQSRISNDNSKTSE